MTALRLQAPPSMRLPASLALAMGLHVLALLALPSLWQLGGTLAERLKGSEPAPAADAHGEVIPIKLPTGNKFELVTELGSIAKSTSGQKADTLPSAQAARGTAMSLSQSLADAARQAQAAYERLHPPSEKLRFVAELRLADGPAPATANQVPKPAAAVVAKTPEPATQPAAGPKPADDAAERQAEQAQQREQARQAQEARDMLAQAQRMADEQARRDRDRAQAEERARKQRALQQAIDQASRQPLDRPPGNAAQRPTPRAEDPHPKVFNPAEPYRGAVPDVIAEAPPLPDQAHAPMTAGGPVLGEGAAPERGPGEAVANRTAFFQRLTNHLFQINQVMLAEAIRATPRMTVEVHFTVDRNGRVIAAAVSQSTGDSRLDDKAVAVIQRASPVPRLSSDMPQQKLELSFPVQIYR
jgi:TonB family protein